MKVLVINDDDGHCTVITYTAENLKKCLQHLVDIDFDFQDENAVQDILNNPNATAEEIESLMRDWNAPIDRSSGGLIYIEEVQSEWNFSYGPWE